MTPQGPEALDRTSFVPLYYQLQEALKQHIESGGWRAGEALPSEPTLARRFGVSRVVVRQALAILEDDHQIIRVRGRGTFVAQAKWDTPVCGLAGLLGTAGSGGVSVLVLDVSRAVVEKSVRERLDASRDDDVLRVTTVVHLNKLPTAICYSYFRRAETGELEIRLRPGEHVPPGIDLCAMGVELGGTQVSIETSQCGQFEADRFNVQHRTPVFLVSCVQYQIVGPTTRPFEVARIEYRGDIVQLRLDVGRRERSEGEAFVAALCRETP